ncbi:hypothetical protein M3Y94_00659300 [Aphelenchoides besseyi]|nr:hypothetical protein M3Y94_00659300 [Aphelenchoides besseyi]KAI6231234.1 hypothetical protein M3Y95_00359700 [Aphelenchoides besseyi]
MSGCTTPSHIESPPPYPVCAGAFEAIETDQSCPPSRLAQMNADAKMLELKEQLEKTNRHFEFREQSLNEKITLLTHENANMLLKVEELKKSTREAIQQRDLAKEETNRWMDNYQQLRGGVGNTETSLDCRNCIELTDKLTSVEQLYFAERTRCNELKEMYEVHADENGSEQPNIATLSMKLEKACAAYKELQVQYKQRTDIALERFTERLNERTDEADRNRQNAEYYQQKMEQLTEELDIQRAKIRRLQSDKNNDLTSKFRFERSLQREKKEAYRRAEAEAAERYKHEIRSLQDRLVKNRRRFADLLKEKETENTTLKQKLNSMNQPQCPVPDPPTSMPNGRNSIFKSATELSFQKLAADSNRKRRNQCNDNVLPEKRAPGAVLDGRLSSALQSIDLSLNMRTSAFATPIFGTSRNEANGRNVVNTRKEVNDRDDDSESDIQVITPPPADQLVDVEAERRRRREREMRRKVIDLTDDDVVVVDQKCSSFMRFPTFYLPEKESERAGFRSIDFTRLTNTNNSSTRPPCTFSFNPAIPTAPSPPQTNNQEVMIEDPTQQVEEGELVEEVAAPVIEEASVVDVPTDFNWMQSYCEQNGLTASNNTTFEPAPDSTVDKTANSNIAEKEAPSLTELTPIQTSPVTRLILNDEEQRLLDGDD